MVPPCGSAAVIAEFWAASTVPIRLGVHLGVKGVEGDPSFLGSFLPYQPVNCVIRCTLWTWDMEHGCTALGVPIFLSLSFQDLHLLDR